MEIRSLLWESYLRRGQLQSKVGNWSEAEKSFSKAVDLTSQSNARAMYLLANAQFHQKKYPESLRWTERAVELDPSKAIWKIRLGALYERAKRHETAAETYKAATASQPTNVEWLLRLAKAQVASNQNSAALETLRAAVAVNPSDLASLSAYIVHTVNHSPVWQRIEALRLGLAAEPNNPKWLHQLGDSLLTLGQYADAADAFKKATILGAADAPMSFNHGLAAAYAGSKSESSAAFKLACSMDGKFRSKEFGPGAYFQSRGNWAAAFKYYAESLAINDSSPDLRYRTGLAADRNHLWQDAEKHLYDAVVSSPEHASWHYRLGLASERLGHYGRAADAYGAAINTASSPQQYWTFRRAYCLEKAGHKIEAMETYLDLYPNDQARSWIDASGEIRLVSSYDREIFEKNLSYLLSQQHATALYERGTQYLREGIFDLANRALYEAVVRDAHQQPERVFRLAVSFVAMDDLDSALFWFRQTRIFQRPDGISAEPYLKHQWQRDAMQYVEFSETLPIDSEVVVYEAYFGGKIDCNPLAIYRELQMDDSFNHLHHVWVVNDSTIVPDDVRRNPRVRLVTRGSVLYRKYLATAGYLINNVTFPHFFVRRDGQNYMNTWHGTPLKTLGRDIQTGFMEHANVSRNFLQATHLLAPNKHTEQVLIQRYDIEGLYSGTLGQIGTPRSDEMINLSKNAIEQLRVDLDVPADARIIFYAPTWRGSLNTKHFDSEQLLSDLRRMQDTGAYVLFRAHHMTEALLEGIDLGVTIVPSEISSARVLAITDVLVTDYSSIFFDFLPMKKPIVFHAYDLSEYSEERGLYFELEQMPGIIARTSEELSEALRVSLDEGITDLKKFERATARFAPSEDGHAAKRAIEYLFDSSSKYKTTLETDSRKKILIHQSLLPNGITSSLLNLLHSMDPSKYRIIFLFDPAPFKNEPERLEKFKQLPSHVQRIARVGAHLVSLEERWVIDKFNAWHEWASREQESIYRHAFDREFRRLFGGASFETSVEFDGYASFWAALMAASLDATKHKVCYMHNRLFMEWSTKYPELKGTFKIAQWFDRLLSVSKITAETNRDELAELFGLPKDKFDFADNTMLPGHIYEASKEDLDTDLERFINNSPDVWLTIGRMSPEKGHKKLISAFAEHLKTEPESKLVVLGDGPLKADLESQIARLELSGSVLLAGQRSNPFAMMLRADAFILASDHEGQPMVLLEALTLGKPTIATDIVGNRGVLGTGFGLLVENSIEGVTAGLRSKDSFVPERRFDIEFYQENALTQAINAFTPAGPLNISDDELVESDGK